MKITQLHDGTTLIQDLTVEGIPHITARMNDMRLSSAECFKGRYRIFRVGTRFYRAIELAAREAIKSQSK